MHNVIWIISTILIFSILGIVFNRLYSNKKFNSKSSTKLNIIKPNIIFFVVGLGGLILFLVGIILAWFLDNTTNTSYKILYCCLLLLFAIGLYGYLLIFYLNYKIYIYDDHFIYQNFWRVRKTIYYKDVVINKTKIYPQVRQKLDNGKTKLIFKLAGILENEDAFMMSYKDWKNGKSIKTKSDKQ